MAKKLKITQTVEDEATQTFSLTIRFKDLRGNRKELSIPRSLLNEPRRFVAELNNHGAKLPTGKLIKTVLAQLKKTEVSAEHIYRASQVGWQIDGCYVSFTESRKPEHCERNVIAPVSKNPPRLATSGSLREWKRTVALPAKHSSPMIFSVCAAFAAMTLRTVGLNTFGFILVGPSKIGKSLTQLVAGSVYGFSEEKHLPNFRRSDPALEELTASFNDHLLIVNEGELVSGESEKDRGRAVRKFAYRLAEGQSKAFSKHVSRDQTFYRTIFIGSMENPSTLASTAASGSHARLFDIPAVRTNARDVFDCAPKGLKGEDRETWGDDRFKSIRDGIKANHGVAYQPFVDSLIEDEQAAKTFLTQQIERFFNSIVPANADPVTRHIARHVAHVVAAGLLARRLGILPWSPRRIKKAARRCFFRALKSLPSERNLFRAACQRLEEAFDDGRLVRCHSRSPAESNLADAIGFYEGSATKCRVTIRAEAFKSLMGGTDVAVRLLSKLDAAGLINSKKHNRSASRLLDYSTHLTWPNGARARSIVIKWHPKKIKKAIQ